MGPRDTFTILASNTGTSSTATDPAASQIPSSRVASLPSLAPTPRSSSRPTMPTTMASLLETSSPPGRATSSPEPTSSALTSLLKRLRPCRMPGTTLRTTEMQASQLFLSSLDSSSTFSMEFSPAKPDKVTNQQTYNVFNLPHKKLHFLSLFFWINKKIPKKKKKKKKKKS